jgi:peptidoglycan/xylan/chitin deacetylase (PgdA/CDA1 family)
MHLEHFRRYYRVVAPEGLAEPGRLPRRALCVTFDDGFRSVYEHAWPRLRAAGIPAIVYLVAEALEPGRLLWVNELNWWLHRYETVARPIVVRHAGTAADASVAALIEGARRISHRDRMRSMLAEIRNGAGPAAVAECHSAALHLDDRMIAEMAADGVRFGSHTCTHASLPWLPDDERREEIAGGRSAVAALPGACDSFAYPFGDTDEATRRAVASAGFHTIMEVGGWTSGPARIARVPVAAVTRAELFAEMEVVAPVKGLLKRLLAR